MGLGAQAHPVFVQPFPQLSLGRGPRSMGHERKVQLVLLAFQKALTMNVNLNAFVEKFALKSRRIVL